MPNLTYVPVPPEDPPAEGAAPPDLWTTGRVAAFLRVPLHRVQYAITSRRIPPAARAGRLRLFNREGVQRIADALRSTSSSASGGGR